jgi:hypothetical protein
MMIFLVTEAVTDTVVIMILVHLRVSPLAFNGVMTAR